MYEIKHLLDQNNNSTYFNSRYNSLLDKLPAVIFEVIFNSDRVGKCIYMSSRCEELTGVHPNLIMNDMNNFYSIIHKDDLFKIMIANTTATDNLDIEFRIIHFKTKEIRWLQLSSTRHKSLDNDNYLWAGIITDITEKKKNEEMLFLYATTDALTNLYNRRYFYEIVEKEIQSFKEHNIEFSILLLDLDHFKHINDRFGHNFGDVTLKHFVKQINRIIRPNDYFGRIGGEEFCVLFKNTPIEEAKSLASKCREVVERNPVSTNFGNIYLTVSGGLVEIENNSLEVLKLMGKADKALYMAKESGRNRIIYI